MPTVRATPTIVPTTPTTPQAEPDWYEGLGDDGWPV